ncbi:SMC-Scp complex subunit ScpB, partial [Micromonospora echinofusca]|nr:SMC-Scp complex subunit ScpB [Micromonospora echinofusca]
MSSDERTESLAEQAAAWVPPWAREQPATPVPT